MTSKYIFIKSYIKIYIFFLLFSSFFFFFLLFSSFFLFSNTSFEQLNYTILEGANVGDWIELEYEPIDGIDTKEAGQDQSATEAGAKGTQNKPTTCSYLRALTIKTVEFQKTRACQCFIIMVMPVVLMVGLLLLNLLFDGIKVTSMCGPGKCERNFFSHQNTEINFFFSTFFIYINNFLRNYTRGLCIERI